MTLNTLIKEITQEAFKNVEAAMKPIIEHEGEEDYSMYVTRVETALEQLSDADCICRASPESYQCEHIIKESRKKIVEKLAEIGVF